MIRDSRLNPLTTFAASTTLSASPLHSYQRSSAQLHRRRIVDEGTPYHSVRQELAAHSQQSSSNAQNLSDGYPTCIWLNPSFISGTGANLDPAARSELSSCRSRVWHLTYDFAAVQLMGLMSQVNTTYNQDKNATFLIPSGALRAKTFPKLRRRNVLAGQMERHAQSRVYYGVRYSLLQPPYEANGEQVSPTVNMHQWFTNRWQAMQQGTVTQPDRTFDGALRPGEWERSHIGPGTTGISLRASPLLTRPMQIAVCFMPCSETPVRVRSAQDMVSTSITSGKEWSTASIARAPSGLTTTISNPAGVLRRGLHAAPHESQDCRAKPIFRRPAGVACPRAFPDTVTPPGPNTYGLAISWGIDDKLKTPYSHVVDFSITRDLGHNFVMEATYTGRFAHHLLQEESTSRHAS